MPWPETDSMTERRQCMAADLNHGYAMTELCEHFGSRRHTGDTWGRRETAAGSAGLPEQRRAPHRGPHRMSEAVEAARWEAQRAHRPWGPRQIRPYLAPRRPDRDRPAPSPAGELCKRAGLRQARPRRRRHRPAGASPL